MAMGTVDMRQYAIVRRFMKHIFNIGRCSRCIRQSFNAGAVAWSAAVALSMLNNKFNSDISCLYYMIPGILLSSLWITHVTVFAFRSAVTLTKPADFTPEVQTTVAISRRSFFINFASSAAWIALFTSFPALASPGDTYWCGPRDYRGTYCARNQQCCFGYHMSHPHAYCCDEYCDNEAEGYCESG